MSSVERLFAQTFHRTPAHVASAPGRVNLIGEHSDYNGGQVLPMAIEQRTSVAVRSIAGHSEGDGRVGDRADAMSSQSRVVSDVEPSVGTFDARHPKRAGAWWDYVAGVAEHLQSPPPQAELAVTSTVPVGAGVSSSAALEVATALALSALSGTPIDVRAAATVAWETETKFVGVPCGIMDQFASALGERGAAVHIWCDTLTTELIPCPETVLIFDTGVRRELRQSQFAQRRSECEAALAVLRQANPPLPDLAHATIDEVEYAKLPQTLLKRAMHVVLEQQRVELAVSALRDGGTIPGDVLVASHESLRVLFECSIPELDWFVDRVTRFPGVRGARLTGAGWGGCAIATGEPDALAAAAESLARDYSGTFPHVPRTWLTHAADGARLDVGSQA